MDKYYKFISNKKIKPQFKLYSYDVRELSKVVKEKSVDIVITSNITSAAVDAYLSGVPVITYLGSDMLNYSPLRGKKVIKFASNFNEIKKYIKFISEKKYVPAKDGNYFLLDKNLKIWKKITLN